MFDKLIDLIVTFINDILPFKIVDQWECGVHLRFGKFKKVTYPGLNWKVPFFDQILATPVITQTVNLKPQTVTSEDEKCVVLSSIVRYHIHDVEKFLLGVMHANDVLVDTTQGIIRDIVEGCKWSDLYDLGSVVTPEVNNIVGKWGITVEQVSFPDLGQITTYRIMTDGNSKEHPLLVTAGLE
jgi:regulator of protease activity HflC (stomatin/prohibitin superfamily)